MRFQALVVAVLATSLVASCTPSKEESKAAPSASATASAAPAAFDPSVLAVFQPLPKTADGPAPESADRVALGKMLYFEARLSKNHDVSCNTCHKLDAFGVDGLPTSEGHKSSTARILAESCACRAAFCAPRSWAGMRHERVEPHVLQDTSWFLERRASK